MNVLLAGYASSSSSSEEEDDDAPRGDGRDRDRDRDRVRVGVPSSNEPPLPPPLPTSTTNANAKGRKLLSYASLLPPEVWERLVRGRVDVNESDEDSNDSGDDDGKGEGERNDEDCAGKGKQVEGKNLYRGRRAPASTTVATKGGELSWLLSDLNRHRPASAARTPAAVMTTPSTAVGTATKERLGASFVATTVKRTKSSKRSVPEEDEEEEDSEPPLPFPSTSSNPTDPLEGRERGNVRPSGNSQRSAVVAAPRVRDTMGQAALPLTWQAGQDNPHSYDTSSLPNSGAPSQSHPIPPNPVVPRSGAATVHSKKRSRQELERALRQGRMEDAVLHGTGGGDDPNGGGVSFLSLAQPPPDAHAIPSSEMYAAGSAPTVHGIRVAAAPMYDPKVGAAVVGTSHAGRGKNQIHHLMASAAQLELQRARQPESQSGKIHRANARQKYGW